VLDAPPTGRIARFLNVNSEVAGLARMGPVRQQADSVMNLLRSRRTAVHLVTLLEEMPVQETIDGVKELIRVDLPVGGVVVNMVREAFLPPDQLAPIAGGGLGRRRDRRTGRRARRRGGRPRRPAPARGTRAR
jgi:anion-transporting  ArsA/GET3 family ATPase